MIRSILPWTFMLVVACGPQPAEDHATSATEVESSGKQDIPVAQMPPEVVRVATGRIADLKISSAESETRDGRRYFDVGGTRADGSEVELDIMEEGGRWRVVETQRDIAFAAAPQAVLDAARAHDASIEPTRVIESRQEDGLIIYELFAPAGGDPRGRKVEIKWDGRQASVLTREWAH